MTLDSLSKYPTGRSYVLKLHRDANAGAMSGRLENMATGAHCEFGSGEELISWLASDLGSQDIAVAVETSPLR